MLKFMNMIKITTFLMLLFVFYTNYAQDIAWVNDTSTTTISVEPQFSDVYNEDIFFGGLFQGTTVFGTTSYLSYGGKDIFVSKMSSDGRYIKTIQIGGVNNDVIKDVKISNDGFVYVLGNFSADITIEGNVLTNTGQADGFLAKFDNDLNLVWAKNIFYGSVAGVQATAKIVFNSQGELIIGGLFKNEIVFNNSVSPVTITSNAIRTSFISKFDINGDYINSVTFDGTNNGNNINDIQISSNDNIYFVNNFKDKVYYFGDSIMSTGSTDADGFVMKLDGNLNFQWIRKVQGTDYDNLYTVEIDNNENIYMAGYFKSSDMVVDSTSSQVSSITPLNKGGLDWLLMSYNSGGELRWLKYAGSPNADAVYNSSFANEKFFVSGYYGGDIIIDNDTIVNPYTTKDAAYITVNPIDGTLIGFETITGLGSESGLTVVNYEDNLNTTYIRTGTFTSDTVFIGRDTVVNSDINNNKTDMFIIKNDCRSDIYPAFSLDSITCPGGDNGVISVIITDGTDTINNNWSYLWSNNLTNDTISGLVEGDYIATITSAKGCIYSDTSSLTHKAVLKVSLIDTLTLNCIASNDGEAAIIPSFGNIQGDTLTSDYHYIWNDGSTDSLRTDLEVGQYIVTISDLCGDTTQIIDTINIGHIPIMQNYLQSQNVMVLCDTSSNGVGRVITSDGVAPFKYEWENSNTDTTSAVANDLTVGLHHVTITDYCNVPQVDSVTVVNIPTIGSQITDMQNATCEGMNNGSATVTAFNGIEPYVYAWSASSDTTATSSVLPGDSMIYVTVSDICHEVVDSVKLGVNPVLEINLVNVQNAKCSSTNDGYAEVTLTNEQGTITYSWSASASDSSVANNLPGDSLIFVSVTDMCGTKTDSVQIGVNPALQVSALAEDTKCNSDTTGKITLTTSNEFGAVVYRWANLTDTTSSIDSLIAGTYYYTVTDACSDTIKDSIVVISPEALKDSVVITNASELGANDGSAVLIVSGGTPTYTYDWSNGAISYENSNIMVGTYYYTITDANNCEKSDSVVVDADKYDVVIFNTFTPNGDGVNDVWNIKNIERFPNCKVQVYSQWGNQVFTSDGYSEPWNGTKDNTGKELPAGTYYYTIDLGNDMPNKSGNVTIMK